MITSRGRLSSTVFFMEKENYFCIVDMHAITTNRDPELLCRHVYETAALYITAGLNPVQSALFIQSHVRAHAECCWILICVTPVGWLERMTKYPCKSDTVIV